MDNAAVRLSGTAPCSAASACSKDCFHGWFCPSQSEWTRVPDVPCQMSPILPMILTKCLNSCEIMHLLPSDPFTNETDDKSCGRLLSCMLAVWPCRLFLFQGPRCRLVSETALLRATTCATRNWHSKPHRGACPRHTWQKARMTGAIVEETMWQAPVSQKPPSLGGET